MNARTVPLKLITPLVLTLLLVLSACVATPTGAPGAGATATPGAPATTAPTDSPRPSTPLPPAAALAAQQVLAQRLNLKPADVTLVSYDSVEWPDACLGIETPGQACAQVITPGFRVVLEAAGKRYEYHTDATGGNVQLSSSPETGSGSSSELLLTWHREGGLKGYCNDLELFADGLAVATSCEGNVPVEVGRRHLTADELQQVNAWKNAYQSFEYGHKDPATADAITIRLAFFGSGTAEAPQAEQQAVLDFAAKVHSSLESILQ